MDSNRIKRLATGAREQLRREVEGRLDAVLATGSAERLSDRAAVEALEARVAAEGRSAVVDSAAYTWFNRLCALRLMDARGYAPTPVVTPRVGSTLPAVLADAQRGAFEPEYEVSPEARSRVAALLAGEGGAANATEAAYAELLRAACDRYAGPMPFLFSERAASWLLMPPGLLAEGSILRRVVEEMDAESCESVEVLGWLYQHYIAERKDEVFASFKKGGKAGPDEIGPATQLFTPEWVVRYLCENSLGRLWMLNNPGSPLEAEMDYYIAPDGDEPHCEIASASDIRVLDPACGSGHILVRAFDLLFSMYEEEGWPPEDIPAMILENNLRGLEVSGRAAEIAKFALVCKALERDPRFLDHPVAPDVRVLEPAELDEAECALLSERFLERTGLLDAMAHMTEAGSLYAPADTDAAAVRSEMGRVAPAAGSGDAFAASALEKLKRMLANVEALEGAYHCVIANPPYMGSSNMNKWLNSWVKSNYPDEKSDLCAAFIWRVNTLRCDGGMMGVAASNSWMFVSSFERARKRLLDNADISTLVQLSVHGFESVAAQVFAFTCMDKGAADYKGAYIRLNDYDHHSLQAQKTLEAIRNPDCGWFYRCSVSSFESIPGTPIAYWASDTMRKSFANGVSAKQFGRTSKGLITGDNGSYFRLWWEISNSAIAYRIEDNEQSLACGTDWFPLNKGGIFRKWYGNHDYVIHWEDDGRVILDRAKKTGHHAQDYDSSLKFKPNISWSVVSSGKPAFRFRNYELSDHVGMPFFPDAGLLKTFLALLNSSVIVAFLSFLSPTMVLNIGELERIPILEEVTRKNETTHNLVDDCIDASRTDWDSFETSWDFKRHPLV